MGDKPNLELGIYRVAYITLIGEWKMICQSDLIFVDDQPYIVLEWAGPPENQSPYLKIAISPTLLHPPTMDGYTVYDGEVADPRKIH